MKMWLLYFDIKWTQICILNDNQWRYHINNPSAHHRIKYKHQQRTTTKYVKNGKSTKYENKNNKAVDEQKDFEEEDDGHNQRLNNLHLTQKSDMSFFVKYRQTLGNIRVISKYFAVSAALSILVSLVAMFLFDDDVIVSVLMLIPIVLIYALWLNTPAFDDIFSLRKEVQWSLIYALISVLSLIAIHVTLVVTDYDIEYAKELELSLIFLSHFLIFGVFMVCRFWK